MRIAIITADFYKDITAALVEGATSTLNSEGISDQSIDLYTVPGAFELPLIAKKCAKTGRYNAIICLGAVIQGDTPHFDYICSEAARGIGAVSLEFEIPVIFSVLTTDTKEQAWDRAGGKKGNKGSDSAATAVKMANIVSKF